MALPSNKPFFVLAPMDDVTDTVFRRIVADCAPPDLFFTEFVNVDGLQSPGRPALLKRIQFTDKETPLVAQIWGLKPENFEKTAGELVEMGFAGIDLNMGCPDKTVVKNGACSALINNRELANQIIQAVQKGSGGKVPVSVKTRLGFNNVDLSWIEFLLQHKLSMLTIHSRTRKEMSKVPARWEIFREIKALRDRISPDTLLVGNGDVEDRAHGRELAERYGLDGIMIGRGVFHDPYAFSETSPWENMTPKQRTELYTKHVKLFAKTWPNGERPINTLNKFCKIYISGFPGSKEFRERLMDCKNCTELLSVLDEIDRYATASS